MSEILRVIVYFILTLFWGVIGFHSGGELAGGIVAVLGSGLTGIGAEIISKSVYAGVNKSDWKTVLYSGIGTILGLIIILSFVYAKG